MVYFLKSNILKFTILSSLLILTLWFFGSTIFVKAQIANSFNKYVLDSSEDPVVVIAPIKGNLVSTIYSATYSRRTGNTTDGTSALSFERAIFPLSKNKNIKQFIFTLESNSYNGVAAEEISRVIKQIPQPTTVIIKGEVGRASYIIASGADRIIMEEGAVIKNIGDVELVVNREDYDGTIKRECATTTNTIYTLTEDGCTSFLDNRQLENLKQYVMERTQLQQEIIASNRQMPIEKVRALVNKEIPSSEAL